MNTSILIGILLIASIAQFSSAKKIVCYYGSWNLWRITPENLDPNLCTHINYAFVAINGDGSLKSEDPGTDVDGGGYYRVTDLKKKNGNLKVLLSIGGASAPSQTFASIAKDAGKRAAMVGSARWFVETYHFDGIDLDWEVPNGGDKANFIALLQDFRNDFNKNGWLVTAAVSADPSDGYDAGKLANVVDWINIMTYDMYGPWSDYTGQNSALWASSVESQWEKDNLNMDAAVRNWKNAGVPANKICAGIAFYGHTFQLQSASNAGLHAPIKGAGKGGSILGESGTYTYNEFCVESSQWQCTWDAEQKNPYCTKGDQWLGYDDEGSIRNKVAYINSNNLAGAMVWSIDQDDVNGQCGQAKPLLRAIHDNLN